MHLHWVHKAFWMSDERWTNITPPVVTPQECIKVNHYMSCFLVTLWFQGGDVNLDERRLLEVSFHNVSCFVCSNACSLLSRSEDSCNGKIALFCMSDQWYASKVFGQSRGGQWGAFYLITHFRWWQMLYLIKWKNLVVKKMMIQLMMTVLIKKPPITLIKRTMMMIIHVLKMHLEWAMSKLLLSFHSFTSNLFLYSQFMKLYRSISNSHCHAFLVTEEEKTYPWLLTGGLFAVP